jgi:hypothetical protein
MDKPYFELIVTASFVFDNSPPDVADHGYTANFGLDYKADIINGEIAWYDYTGNELTDPNLYLIRVHTKDPVKIDTIEADPNYLVLSSEEIIDETI